MSDHAETDDATMSDHADRRASDRHRAAKLRERREQAGQVRISAWVPRERAAYARQVLRGAAAGANTLPPDPGQQADLDTIKAKAAAAQAELEEVRAAAGRQVEQARSAEAAARAEAEALQRRERAAQEAADTLRGELAGIKGRRGWRGVLLRLAGA